MYRELTVYRLSAEAAEGRLAGLLAANSALQQKVPGLVSYSLTRSDPDDVLQHVVRMAVSADGGSLEECLRHPLMAQLDAALTALAEARESIRTPVDPDAEWYRAQVPDVWSDLSDVLRPEHCALLVIDVQNDFCSPGGVRTTPTSLEMSDRIREHLVDLVSVARRAGVPVVYTRVETGGEHDTGPVLARRRRVGLEGAAYTRTGTWGWEICDYLAPVEGDHVVDKATHSAFSTRMLDALLQRLAVKTLLVTGVITNGCVEGTVRDAFARGYYVVVPEDAVATYDEGLQRHSLENMSRHFGLLSTTADVLASWRTA